MCVCVCVCWLLLREMCVCAGWCWASQLQRAPHCVLTCFSMDCRIAHATDVLLDGCHTADADLLCGGGGVAVAVAVAGHQINLTDPMFTGEYRGKQKHPSDLNAVLDRGRVAGMERMIITAGSLDDAAAALELAAQHDDLYCTVGCHPTRCEEYAQAGEAVYTAALEELIAANKGTVVALGECGLDYARLEFCPKDIQVRQTSSVQRPRADRGSQQPFFPGRGFLCVCVCVCGFVCGCMYASASASAAASAAACLQPGDTMRTCTGYGMHPELTPATFAAHRPAHPARPPCIMLVAAGAA